MEPLIFVLYVNQRGIAMSESLYPPFLHWGDYTSTDAKNPDEIQVTITQLETFETQYSICVNAIIEGDEMSIPLYSFSSYNKQLHQKWNKLVEKEKIIVGSEIVIRTWKETSKKNKTRQIRRFELVT